uniref:Uncharacterized protein n=1 Tax=Helianthus annuus TaxID=4232 RepID=A0A251U172_HELAN
MLRVTMVEPARTMSKVWATTSIGLVYPLVSLLIWLVIAPPKPCVFPRPCGLLPWPW